MNRPLVVLAAHTAALRGAPHLVELAAVRVVEGEAADPFESLVCPPVPVESEATSIHGIGEDDLRRAPMAADVLERFAEWVGADRLAAHEATTTAEVLGFEFARAGLPAPGGPWLDGSRLAAELLTDAPDHGLQALAEYLELERGDFSGALAQAVLCWKVLEECSERAAGQDGAPASMADLLSRCGPPLTIASRAPRRPHLARRLRPLESARLAQEPVTVLYGAGADAPASVQFAPRFFFVRSGHDYLEAECASSGLLKTYRLDRIRKVLT
ncbi:MAG: exonuclease domain-containing protein [Planctomycetota bacterium]